MDARVESILRRIRLAMDGENEIEEEEVKGLLYSIVNDAKNAKLFSELVAGIRDPLGLIGNRAPEILEAFQDYIAVETAELDIRIKRAENIISGRWNFLIFGSFGAAILSIVGNIWGNTSLVTPSGALILVLVAFSGFLGRWRAEKGQLEDIKLKQALELLLDKVSRGLT